MEYVEAGTYVLSVRFTQICQIYVMISINLKLRNAILHNSSWRLEGKNINKPGMLEVSTNILPYIAIKYLVSCQLLTERIQLKNELHTAVHRQYFYLVPCQLLTNEFRETSFDRFYILA